MIFADKTAMERVTAGSVKRLGDGVEILDADALKKKVIDALAMNSMLNERTELRDACRRLIKDCARASGIYFASIQNFYEALGREDIKGLTVPAINIRGLTYDVARAVFRAAIRLEAGAVIFEIARSEIGYTNQRPAEYAASVAAAAVKEGFTGPLFLQGDHFQVNAKKYAADPEKELEAISGLILEAMEAGFYNIDIDTSTLVDLSKPALLEQQRLNYQLVAKYVRFIRKHQPEGITVSIGGEIGEVGGKNSDVAELDAFMEGLTKELQEEVKGISKISVQSGTTHGGVVLPDGSIADVKLDFNTLEQLSERARHYGMAGAVQHGASTLPEVAFHRFPETRTAEIHLATQFQNMVYDHEAFPQDLLNDIYRHLAAEHSNERKSNQTDQQFYYTLRKKGWGPFKKQLHEIPQDIRDSMMAPLEEKFEFLFRKLRVINTGNLIRKYVRAP